MRAAIPGREPTVASSPRVGPPLSGSDTVRTALVAVSLGLVVGVHSVPVVVGGTVLALIAAGTWRLRLCCSVMGLGMLLGVPWVLLPAVAGAVWALARRLTPGTPPLRLHQPRSLRAWSAAGAAGLVAGGLACVPMLRQLGEHPLTLEVTRPPTQIVIVAILVMAVLNGAGEELIWRGALGEAGAGVPVGALFALQAVSFGVAHLHGLPGGVPGVILTGLFSLACTGLHLRMGLIGSVVAHVGADLVIFAVAYPYVSFSGWWAPS